MPATIRDIVREKARERGITLFQLSVLLGVSYAHLHHVLKGVYTSRPLIARISKFLDLPELPNLYEQFLHEKRMASKGVESNAHKSTSDKGGGR